MYFVYIIQSEKYPTRFYTGFTTDVEKRLEAHNNGQSTHTSKFKPWRLKTYLAFSDKEQALKFERYLKTPSGRAFAHSPFFLSWFLTFSLAVASKRLELAVEKMNLLKLIADGEEVGWIKCIELRKDKYNII